MTKKSATATARTIVVAWKSDTPGIKAAPHVDISVSPIIMRTGRTFPPARNTTYVLVVSSESVKDMEYMSPTKAQGLGIRLPRNFEDIPLVVIVVERLPRSVTTRDNSALVRKHGHDHWRMIRQAAHWNLNGRPSFAVG